jgi:hypothetical protein
MAGFVDYDDMINKLTVSGKLYEWDLFKISPATTHGAGVWQTLWKAVGTPGAGADPATTPGVAHDDTAGGIIWPDQASDKKVIVSFGALSMNAGSLMLYDRLCSVGGISLASTGNKTINSAALPRYSGAAAANVQAWLEVTTATTVTAPVVSLNSYTNEAGTTGRAGGTLTFPAAATNQYSLIGPLPLQAGDKGVRSVEVGLNVGTAASAGVCNLVLLRQLASVQLSPYLWSTRDLIKQTPSRPRIFDGATLGLAFAATTGTGASVWGKVRVAYG